MTEPPEASASPRGHRPIACAIGATGLHLGLLTVCASAGYTDWQRSIVTMSQWAAYLMVAAAVLASALGGRGRWVHTPWARLTLALAGLMVLRLSYLPQLEEIPAVAARLPGVLLETYPGIAVIGVIVAGLSWLVYRACMPPRPAAVASFAGAVAAATVFLVAVAGFNWLMLSHPHGLMASEALRPVLIAVQGGIVAGVLLTCTGGPGVGRAPAVYMAAALIAAFVRNMAAPPQ